MTRRKKSDRNSKRDLEPVRQENEIAESTAAPAVLVKPKGASTLHDSSGSLHALRIAPIVSAIAWVFVVFMLYWIYGARPVVAEPWQWADDGLYMRQAEGLVHWLRGDAREWLGRYDSVLLSKAPLFGVWLGVLRAFQIPLRLAEFALLLMLPWLFRHAIRPMFALRGWRLMGIAVILVGLPFLPHEQRIVRTALQAGVGGVCLISAVAMVLRARHDRAAFDIWAVLTGAFFGLSYINREETIWLLPVVAAALAATLVGSWASRNWRSALTASCCLIGGFALPVSTVTALNYQSYGIAVTTMRRAPAFTRAHQVLTSLVPDTREHYVPIRTETRLRAYTVSPTFGLLRAHLEGPASDSVAKNAKHLALNGRNAGDREFFVSNFEFELRKAAFQSGARTPTASEALFAKIETELEGAIASGRITAGNHGPAVLAAPLPGDYARISKRCLVSLLALYKGDGVRFPGVGTSSGSAADLQRSSDLTMSSLASTKELQPTRVWEVGVSTRRRVFEVLTTLEKVIYALATVTIIAFAAITASGRPPGPAAPERAFAGVILLGSLVTFGLSMAVVDVLGFPHLQWPGAYNGLGYIPLSVLGAFGVALLWAWGKSPTVGGEAGTQVDSRAGRPV